MLYAAVNYVFTITSLILNGEETTHPPHSKLLSVMIIQPYFFVFDFLTHSIVKSVACVLKKQKTAIA